MPEITSAFRRVPKATYVPLAIEQQPAPQSPKQQPRQSGKATSSRQQPRAAAGDSAAVVKFGFLRQLALQPGEVDAAIRAASSAGNAQAGQQPPADMASAAGVLRAFEGSPMPSLLPPPSALAGIPSATLLAFGNGLVKVRTDAVNAPPKPDATVEAFTATPGAHELYQLHTGITATRNFQANAAATRIGMLNLERLEMTPAGLERGELIATIPLAPMEKTSVVQKEWSVTSQEFTSVVTDSLENYSETGVTDNTELAQSTTSQSSHDNQFNATGSVRGSFGNFVTASAQSGFTMQDKNSTSATDSRKDAVSVTRKASSRSKQSHKVTISTTTTTGTSETSTRTLHNSSPTDPMRIDYFSLMRKWHVGLYRYGLRLTYDIVVPEPGAAMRKTFAELSQIQAQISNGFVFPLKVEDVLPDQNTVNHLADTYGVSLPSPPQAPAFPLTIGGPVGAPGNTLGNDPGWRFFQVPFTIPDGFEVQKITMVAMLGNQGQAARQLNLLDFGAPWGGAVTGGEVFLNQDLQFSGGDYFMQGATGQQTLTYEIVWIDAAAIIFYVHLQPTAQAISQWQMAVWNSCFNGAQTKYYAEQQTLNARLAALKDQIDNVDTLTLRREENDEIMKCVLQWLLGVGFDFMPAGVANLFTANADPSLGPSPSDSLQYGVAFTGNDTSLPASGWSTMFQYEQMVRFINDAIEWENVVYFLYSYFWDVPASWEFIKSIRHTDSTRQGFLRSGSARVVLTVREGFEEAWVKFAEAGAVDAIYDGPYLTIAQQIADYNATNYPGIPPTAAGGGPLPDDGGQVATTSSAVLAASAARVTIAVDSSTGFIAGYSAVIDTFDSGAQEAQPIVDVPDATHITLKMLNNAHDGSKIPFAVMQAGEKGVLIAEWFEYTPSSGTDIAVTSNLATIA